MLDMQGIPREVIENSSIIFGRAQYVVEPDKNGEIINRIWLFPLFTKSWLSMKPIDRIEDEDIDPVPLEDCIKRVLQEDNEQLLGFAYMESYWADNPKAEVYFGFFDKEKRSATRMEAYTSQIKGSNAWQLFMDFTKRHMYDESFDTTSQELQDLATALIGID